MQENKEKIAVILPNHLGDVVMATPALRALRRGRPDAQIVGVLRGSVAAVLESFPHLDRLIKHEVYEASQGRMASRRALAAELGPIDTVIVFPNSFSSALLARMTDAPVRIGYRRRWRGRLLTHAVTPPRRGFRFRPQAMERYYLDLVRALDCPDLGTDVELYTDAKSEAECDRLMQSFQLDSKRPLVAIAPGAGFGPSKLWPLRYVAEVAQALMKEGAELVLVYAPNEEALADEIMRHAGPGIHRMGGAGMGLGLLKSVIARSSLLLCNDAGARHLAAAFRIPTLVMMGPTSIRYTNLNLGTTRLLREAVKCSPCQLRSCPIDHRCMQRLSPSRVIEEAKAALFSADWRGSTELELA